MRYHCKFHLQDMPKKSSFFIIFISLPAVPILTKEPGTSPPHGQNSKVLPDVSEGTSQRWPFPSHGKTPKHLQMGKKQLSYPLSEDSVQIPLELLQVPPKFGCILSNCTVCGTTDNVLQAVPFPGHVARYSSAGTDFSA